MSFDGPIETTTASWRRKMRSALGGATLALVLLAAPVMAQQGKPDSTRKPVKHTTTGTVKAPTTPPKAVTAADTTKKTKTLKKKKHSTTPKPSGE